MKLLNCISNSASARGKTGLVSALGSALLLASLAVAVVWAAPPRQAPEQTPSAVRGEAIWVENCAPCHGVSGRGDGPTAQSTQMANNPPPDFTDRAAARQRTLAEMFTVTKEGRMDRLMPPWGGRLSDDQIWDVVAYAQTFPTSPDVIAAGEAVYRANCLACHAADGTGAIPGAPDFTDAAAMAAKSPQALFDTVSQGQGQMPAFADQSSANAIKVLSEDERWQVVDYLRTFSYEPITFSPQRGPTGEGIITGQVQNATIGQPIGDVEVRLRHWQGDVELTPLMAQADADGNFRFEGLDTQSETFYRAEVIYDDVSFPAEFVNFEPGTTELSLLLNVYETTTSDQAITVERFHFIVLSDHPGFFSVLELYQFSNHGERAYVGAVNRGGLRQTVRMALPAGAQDVVLQGGSLGVDFLETDEGLVATSPIVPGVETFDVAFVYIVSYTADPQGRTPAGGTGSGKTLNLDRPLYYAATSVNGLLADVGATLESDALAFAGERAIQGQTFLLYTGQDLKAGETLPIRLDSLDKIKFVGSASGPPGDHPTVVTSMGLKQTTLLWMILGLGGGAVVFGLAYPSLRPRLRSQVPANEGSLVLERQRLLLTLARLDQAFEAGELNETVYRRARARRKAELIEVWRRLQDS
jgi:mono/diheme cytochrome c family protein